MRESPDRESGRCSQALRLVPIASKMEMVGRWELSARKRRRLVMLDRDCSGSSTDLALQTRRGIASRSLMGERCSAF